MFQKESRYHLVTSKRLPPPSDCPLDACLKLLAGTWTPKIIYYLQVGPRRFGELRRDLEHISTKVLTQRLRILEKQKVVKRRVLPTRPPSVEYSLTPTGKELGPVLDAMVAVAKKLI